MTIIDTNRILVPNWYEKEHIEGFLGRLLSDNEFQEIVNFWNDDGFFDHISEDIKEWVIDNF